MLRTIILVLAWLPITAFAESYKGLEIQPEQKADSYDRSEFNHWRDEDQDGEDARIEVLLSESHITPTVVTKSNGKKVVQSGLWVGPYTGYVTTDPRTLDIDHLVPLKEAWISGAHAWDDDEREAYANDLSDAQHLIAVKGGANRSKGREIRIPGCHQIDLTGASI